MKALLTIAAIAVLAVAGCKTITEEGPTEANGPDLSTPPTGVDPITARPTASPAAKPDSDDPATEPTDTDDEFIPDNNNPVARMVAKVYFLECNGSLVPGSEYSSQAAVGCRIHLDVTPKDSEGKPTKARGALLWSYGGSPASYAGASDSDYTPTLTVLAPGELIALATVDGITSNTVRVVLTP